MHNSGGFKVNLKRVIWFSAKNRINKWYFFQKSGVYIITNVDVPNETSIDPPQDIKYKLVKFMPWPYIVAVF
jgi:hypothetical protein